MTESSKPVPRGSVRRSGDAGFTLVEVLVVLVIVVILAGVTVPAIVGMGRGSALQGAISNVRSTLSLARQWAITNRKHTYVVFPDVNPSSTEAYAYRAYAVYEYDPVTQVGQYVSDWKFLPKGMVFDDDTGLPQNVYKPVNEESLAYPENSSGSRDLNVIGFKPTGSTLRSSGYEVYLREGYSEVDSGGMVNYGIVHEEETDYGIQVSGLTGGARVINYHGEP